jgi:hypothetical protein
MTLRPTDDQLKALQSVEQSIAGIDAVPNKAAGFDCVMFGWLEHREHRREDGGLIDVWRLTEEGRLMLTRGAPQPMWKLHDYATKSPRFPLTLNALRRE